MPCDLKNEAGFLVWLTHSLRRQSERQSSNSGQCNAGTSEGVSNVPHVSKSNIMWTCELQFFMILKMAHIGSFSEGCTYSYKNIVKASFSIMAISVLNLSLSVSDFYQFSAHPKPEGRGGTWSREWVGSRNRDREMASWSQNWVEVFRSVPGLYGKVLTGFLSVSFGWKRKF